MGDDRERSARRAQLRLLLSQLVLSIIPLFNV